MKSVHIPTLIFHAALTVFGALTLNHYHDAFLSIAALALLVHAVWCARSKQNMLPAHLIGCAAQFVIYQFGIINVHSGAFGLGGGEFALFFYEIAMAISCVIELVIWLVKLMKK